MGAPAAQAGPVAVWIVILLMALVGIFACCAMWPSARADSASVQYLLTRLWNSLERYFFA